MTSYLSIPDWGLMGGESKEGIGGSRRYSNVLDKGASTVLCKVDCRIQRTVAGLNTLQGTNGSSNCDGASTL